MYTTIPLSPIRRIIAARMSEAKRTIPHYRVATDVELDELLTIRRQLRAEKPQVPLSINDLLIKACAAALMDVPAVNVRWMESEIHQFGTADISVVVALKEGLSTPVIQNAQAKSVREIAREVRELAARAAANSLRMHEIVGGSFSISNLGMYGVDEFDAIINPPQCAILAVGRARPTWVVSESGHGRPAVLMRVTLSADHRAIDGVVAAQFLSALRERIARPAHMRPENEGN